MEDVIRSLEELDDARNFLQYLTGKYKLILSDSLYEMLMIAVNSARVTTINGKHAHEIYKDYPYHCYIYQEWKSKFSILSDPQLGRKSVNLTIGNLQFPVPLKELADGKTIFEEIDGLKLFERVSL